MRDTASAAEDAHDLDWNERLLTWVDDDLDAADRAAFEAHSAGCPRCQQQLQALAQLDESLVAALPPLALDAAFDRAVLHRIDGMNDARAAARGRAEQELQDNLRHLSRNWRRMLGLVVPGVIAGIALAFALVAWLNDAGVMQAVAAEAASGWARGISGMVPTLLTGSVGAAIGAGVARWLTCAWD